MRRDWLSSTWEANWRSFQYFNLYRLILTALFFLAIVTPGDWVIRPLGLPTQGLMFPVAFYGVLVVAGLLLSIHWQQHFNTQLSMQVLVDVLVSGLLLHRAGGVVSGLGVLMLVSLAAASLVGRGRLVLFYAAQGTLALLTAQVALILNNEADFSSLFHAGLISAAFFATAILARLLGQRLMANEELAKRRGIALENQIRISQRVVERMQDGVLIVARGGRVVRNNPMAAQMLGAGGDGMVRLPMAVDAGLAAWRTGSGPASIEFSLPQAGEWRARFESTDSSDGEALIFFEDLGHVRAQAQQLKLAALGRLTASIAHEIRNPLASIAHAGELLREECRDELQLRLLRIVGDNVARLDRIVRDVLDLGRQRQATPECLPLGEFCRAFLEEFSASERLPTVRISFGDASDLRLYFDPSQLHQVLWNLLVNAVRYASDRPGAVQLAILPGNLPGRVELHLRDDGPGVSPADREKIFEPFFTRHHQGTGLGLFIARELCAANGATLDLLPGEGGAHFIIAGRGGPCRQPETNVAGDLP